MIFIDSRFFSITTKHIPQLKALIETSMRSAIYHTDPLVPVDTTSDVHKDKVWQHFHPITNVLWLHFLLFALKLQLEKNTKKHKRFTDDDKSNIALELERIYEERLKEMENILDPRSIGRRNRHGHHICDEAECDECDESQSVVGPIGTAGMVVEYALQRGWLEEEDIFECDL